jgi:hypothetical protein
VPEGPEKNLLGLLQHEDRVHAVDLYLAVNQWSHTVVGADSDGKLKFAHNASFTKQMERILMAIIAGGRLDAARPATPGRRR